MSGNPNLKSDKIEEIRSGPDRIKRGLLIAFAVLLAGYIIAVIARSGSGSHSRLLDNWGIGVFEVALGGFCLWRFAFRSWRSSNITIRFMPAFLGTAVLIRGAGAIVHAIEASGGAKVTVPSTVDVLQLIFYPLFYAAMVMIARNETKGMATSTQLDAAIAGAGTAALCSAYLLHNIHFPAGEGTLASFVRGGYPGGDLFLLAQAAASLALVPKRNRRVSSQLILPCVLIAVGDVFIYFHQTASGIGYVAAALTWPIALYLFAVAMWEQEGGEMRFADTPTLEDFALPSFAAASCLLILISSTIIHIGAVPIALAAVTLALTGIRLRTTFRKIQMLTEEQRRMAVTDDVTGMGNRRHLIQRFDQYFIDHTSEETATLFLVNLDHMKQINDSFGHEVGDRLLTQIGDRLKDVLGEDGLIARLAGDEIAVGIFGIDASQSLDLAAKLLASFETPFSLEAVTLHVSAKVGIAIAPTHALTTSDLLRCANLAVYGADLEKMAINVYEQALDDGGERLALIEELRTAIDERQITLFFQPQMDLRTGHVEAAEALARWPHPVRGMVPPLEFIPLAEDARVMREFTALVLDLALEQCATWRADGRTVCISVNLSATNLLDAEIVETIMEALKKHHLPPSALLLEITESTFVEDFGASKLIVERLVELGIVMSIDDFGTGYSSLSYLSGLSVGELKLDQSFIKGLGEGGTSKNLAIVHATIDLSRALGLRTVAEGIEDQATLDILADLGCDIAQGYFISRPVPGPEMPFEPDASRSIRARH